ncbi:MAG: hypothetical protein WCD20_16235 [Rhodomicrobium sp.]
MAWLSRALTRTSSGVAQLKLDADWVVMSACNTAGAEMMATELCFLLEALSSVQFAFTSRRAITSGIEAGDISVNIRAAIVAEHRSEMNPLHWKREHQRAWAVMCVFGAVLGVLLAFIHSPLFSVTQPWQLLAFVEWLSLPQSYWPWALLGFLVFSCPG